MLETQEMTKSTQQKNPNPSDLCITHPDEVYDIYVDIDNDLQLNINIFNELVAKAQIWFDIGDILRSSFNS